MYPVALLTSSFLHDSAAASVASMLGRSPPFDGSANVLGTATLASIGVAGTYTKVTTDAKGRVTVGANMNTFW